MLIETKLKPRPPRETRRVDVFGKTYVFKQPPGFPDRFIADVADEAAVAALVATGAYTEFTDELPAATLSLAPPVPTPEQVEQERLQKERDAADARAAVARKEQAEREAAAAAATAKAASASTGGSTSPANDGGSGTPVPVTFSDEITKAAKALLSAPAKTIREAVKNGPGETHSTDVLQAALAIEQAESSARPTIVDALKRALAPKA